MIVNFVHTLMHASPGQSNTIRTNDFPIYFSFFKFQLNTNTCHEFPGNETRSSYFYFYFFPSRAFPVHNMARPNPIDYAAQRNPV